MLCAELWRSCIFYNLTKLSLQLCAGNGYFKRVLPEVRSWEVNRGYFADYGSHRLLKSTKDVLLSKWKKQHFLLWEQRKSDTALLSENSDYKEDYTDEWLLWSSNSNSIMSFSYIKKVSKLSNWESSIMLLWLQYSIVCLGTRAAKNVDKKQFSVRRSSDK